MFENHMTGILTSSRNNEKLRTAIWEYLGKNVTEFKLRYRNITDSIASIEKTSSIIPILDILPLFLRAREIRRPEMIPAKA